MHQTSRAALRMTMPVVMTVSMAIDHVACWIMALGSRGGLSGDCPVVTATATSPMRSDHRPLAAGIDTIWL
jgi:hypothetical protein